MCAILISKALTLARVKLTSDHTVLPAIRTFIHIWNEPSCIYSPAAEHQCTWPVFISRPAEGRRLSWPRWFGEYRGCFVGPNFHPSTSHGGREPNSRPAIESQVHCPNHWTTEPRRTAVVQGATSLPCRVRHGRSWPGDPRVWTPHSHDQSDLRYCHKSVEKVVRVAILPPPPRLLSFHARVVVKTFLGPCIFWYIFDP